MNAFLATLDVMLPVFIAVGLAVLFGKFVKVDAKAFSQGVVYLFGPALVFYSLTSAEMAPRALGGIFAMSLVSTVILLGIGWLLSKVLRLPHAMAATVMLAMTLGNTGSIGMPLLEFAFGAQGLQYGAVFYVSTAIAANILGVYIPSSAHVSVKESLGRILKSPMIYAAVLGVAFNLLKIEMPLIVVRTTNLIGYAAIACGLAFMGIRLANMKVHGKIGVIIAVSAARVILTPLVGWLSAILLQVDTLTMYTCILQISVPTALFAAMFSEEFGGDSELASGIILLTTIGSFFSLSVLLALML
ncbi:MAG: AEC family transporter [Anaerolineae bacterium]|nr:AEC family transporter [Anaerolineae bacterium]